MPVTGSASPGRCVHCLRDVALLTNDHVLPRSWYPDITPENLEKWAFPSCGECNARYGRIEEELLLVLGLCLDPGGALSSGVSERALRSINPAYARDDRDRRIREARRKRVQEELFEIPDPTVAGVFPGFGIQAGVEYRRFLAVPLSARLLESFGEKLIRGLTYLAEKQLVYNDYAIEVHFIRADKFEEVQQIFPTNTAVDHRGPGFKVTRAAAVDDPISALFRIEVWGRLNIHGIVFHRRYEIDVERERKRRAK